MTIARRLWQVRTVMATLTIPVLLLAVPLDRLTRRLGGRRIASAAPADAAIAWWVDRLMGFLPWPWRSTCLRRSAVLFHLLRRAGREVELCIGVRRGDDGALKAHAWLVRDGLAYLERGEEHLDAFATIARFPESRAAS